MSVNIHNKLGDILTQLENITGINEKDELKSALLNKKISISDTDNISDMVNKINNAILGSAKPNQVLKDVTFSSNDGLNQKGTYVFDPIIQYSNLEPYYETIQGNGWSKTLEGNVTNITVNTLGDMSVFVSDDKNNLYKFDTNGNQKWKVNIGNIILGIDCDSLSNIYLNCKPTTSIGASSLSFKYDSNGNKLFEYTRKDDHSQSLSLLYCKYDSKHNTISVFYSVYSGSTYYNYWDVYSTSNALVSHVLLSGQLSTLPINFDRTYITSSNELYIVLEADDIFKYNSEGTKLANYILNADRDLFFNVIESDNRVIVIQNTQYAILDLNLNLIKAYNNPLNTIFQYPVKFFNNYDFLANKYNGTNNLNTGLYMFMYDKSIPEDIGYMNAYKKIASGIFDYDGKYLYYSESNNTISKICFDNQYNLKIDGPITESGYSSDPYPALDYSDNSITTIYQTGIKYTYNLIKYDNNLNLVFNKNVSVTSTGSSTYKVISNIIINSITYIFIVIDSKYLYLYKYDKNGNEISNKLIITSDSLHVMQKAHYDKFDNTIVLAGFGRIIKYNLSDSIVFDISASDCNVTSDNSSSYNVYSLNTDQYSNIYILRNNGNVSKYDENGNYISKQTSVSSSIIIDTDEPDNNIYFSTSNAGLDVYNKSLSFTGTIIGKFAQTVKEFEGVSKNGYIYYLINNPSSGSDATFLCICNKNNTDEPIYIIINKVTATYGVIIKNVLVDSNNNIFLWYWESMNGSVTRNIMKIPPIKNTNPYKVFKGYKLVNVTQ